MVKIISCFTLLLGMLAMPAMAAIEAPIGIPVEQFGIANYYSGEGESAGFIVLLSPSAGWDAASAATATSLQQQHYSVLGLDVRTYLAGRAKSPDKCLYPAGLIEDAVQNLQKKYGGHQVYQQPIIVGLGDSGGFATVTGLQILPTFSAIIAPAFCPQLATPKPLCPGDRLQVKNNLYTPHRTIDEKLALRPAPTCGVIGKIPNRIEGWPTVTTDLMGSLATLKAEQAVASTDPLDDLPLTPLRGATANPWLIVFYSGDGGWRDIDKQIGGALQNAGYNVIGVDSLRYFWQAKTPAATATDLDRMIATYSRSWKTSKIAIVGYSFGADVQPFVIPLSKYKGQIRQVALMGLSSNANFEIELDNFLGEGDAAYDNIKAFQAMPPIPTLCIYGQDETEDDDSACPHLTESFVDRQALPGDHHFNGAYESVARLIESRLK